jgi:hypothetical protein
MDTPRTVRVNEAGSDAASYRDAVDERRRVIHVQGSSPKRAYVLLGIAALVWIGVMLWVRLNDHLESGWFVFVGLASLAVLVQLGPPALWRAVQRSRFDLSRRELVVRALRDQLRLTVLRTAGRVVLELAPSGVEITTTPWAVRPLPPRERRAPSAVRLRVTPLDRDPNEARIDVRHEGVEHRLHAPMLTDDARYLARVLEGYEPAERRSESERSPQPRSATR